MKKKTEDWLREIESLSQNGAARVVAAAEGISIEEAADKLLEIGAREGDSTFQAFQMIAKVLGLSVDKSIHDPEGLTHVKFSERYPTVIQWLGENKDRIAIIRAGNLVAYCACGCVLAGGEAIKRNRVTHVIWLDRGGMIGGN